MLEELTKGHQTKIESSTYLRVCLIATDLHFGKSLAKGLSPVLFIKLGAKPNTT